MKSRDDKFVYQGEGNEPGPACVKILTTLKGIQQGTAEDSFGWLEYVEEAKGFGGERMSNGNGVKAKADLMNGSVDKSP